jgi:hypothetical protein
MFARWHTIFIKRRIVMSDTRKAYSVWVEGKQVNDDWLTYQEASDLADECLKKGHWAMIGNRD